MLFLLQPNVGYCTENLGFLWSWIKIDLKDCPQHWKTEAWVWDYYYLYCPSESFQSPEKWTPVFFFFFTLNRYCGIVHFSHCQLVFISTQICQTYYSSLFLLNIFILAYVLFKVPSSAKRPWFWSTRFSTWNNYAFVSKHGTLHTDVSALNERMCSTFDFSIYFPK